MSHPTTTLTYFGDQIDVDEEIAPLIESIWRLEIPTTTSCQGDAGGESAHIGFVDVHGATRFLNVISGALESEPPADYQPDDDYPEPDPPLGFSMLFWRIASWEKLTHSHPRRWQYYCRLDRTFPDHQIRCSVIVDFPHEDLAVVRDVAATAAAEYRDDAE